MAHKYATVADLIAHLETLDQDAIPCTLGGDEEYRPMNSGHISDIQVQITQPHDDVTFELGLGKKWVRL